MARKFLDRIFMTINIEEKNGVSVASLQGRLDVITSAELDKAVAALLDGGAKKILFDLRELEYISSAGLRSMLLAAKKMKAAEGKVALSSLNANVAEVFKISGLASFFDIYTAKDEALVALA